MKKIICLIDSLVSGGAQRQIVGLACLLKKRGYDVSIMTYHNIPFYASILEENNVRHILVRNATNLLCRIPYIYQALKRHSPDVVISFLDVPNIIACMCKQMGLRYKLIVSERNTTQCFSRVERFKFHLYRMADVIVPNSYTQTKFIEKYYPRYKNKLTTITNCAETDLFVPNEYVPKEYNTVLCVGRVTPQKNIIRFIKAVTLARTEGLDITVKWFGRHDKEYYEECKQVITQNRLQEHFLFYDASQDICSEYQRAEVFCLPSIFEGFPNVVGEAMCCGLPVLCSDVCDNHILVAHGYNGLLFDPLDIESISNALISFFKMRQEDKMNMSRRSRGRAIELLNKEVFINRYLDIIER
jgi:glycosyltransferase involved in cell wall biosynthesis